MRSRADLSRTMRRIPKTVASVARVDPQGEPCHLGQPCVSRLVVNSADRTRFASPANDKSVLRQRSPPRPGEQSLDGRSERLAVKIDEQLAGEHKVLLDLDLPAALKHEDGHDGRLRLMAIRL
jgi:hypothetical protein